MKCHTFLNLSNLEASRCNDILYVLLWPDREINFNSNLTHIFIATNIIDGCVQEIGTENKHTEVEDKES